jgi:hypothetical protein
VLVPAVLDSEMAGLAVAGAGGGEDGIVTVGTYGMVTEEVLVTDGPLGGVPVAVPVLEIDPAVTFAAVVV